MNSTGLIATGNKTSNSPQQVTFSLLGLKRSKFSQGGRKIFQSEADFLLSYGQIFQSEAPSLFCTLRLKLNSFPTWCQTVNFVPRGQKCVTFYSPQTKKVRFSPVAPTFIRIDLSRNFSPQKGFSPYHVHCANNRPRTKNIILMGIAEGWAIPVRDPRICLLSFEVAQIPGRSSRAHCGVLWNQTKL